MMIGGFSFSSGTSGNMVILVIERSELQSNSILFKKNQLVWNWCQNSQEKLTWLFAMHFAFFTHFVLDINSEFVVCLTLIHHDVSKLRATEENENWILNEAIRIQKSWILPENVIDTNDALFIGIFRVAYEGSTRLKPGVASGFV